MWLDQAQEHKPLWAEFDLTWYRQRYRQEIINIAGDVTDENLEAFWRNFGSAYGHSPNRYFDEVFYRRNNRSVGDGIHRGIFVSGFQHYDEIGFQECAPHWMFDETGYFIHNPDLTMRRLKDEGLRNGYDHYLRFGQKEQRVSTPFFDPDVLRISLFQARQAYFSPQGEFTRFQEDATVASLRCSWYFDPDWYLEHYPDVQETISEGAYFCALQHYLSNDSPTAFNPNPYFDDAWYCAIYQDVATEVALGKLRNGYEHFIRFGLKEGRLPMEGAVLQPQSICTMRDNAFLSFVRTEGGTSAPEIIPPMAPDARAEVVVRRRAVLFGQLNRSPLDFQTGRAPRLTIIIPVYNDFAGLVDTLTALHGARHLSLQILLIDHSGHRFLTRLDTLARGVEIIREDGADPAHVRAQLISRIHTDKILFLKTGLVVSEASALSIIDQFDSEADLAVIAPLILDRNGRVQEAGQHLWRDGSFYSFGEGAESTCPALQCRRPCDSVGGDAYLCRKESFVRAAHEDDFAKAGYRFATLGARPRERNVACRIIYDPRLVIHNLSRDEGFEVQGDGDRAEFIKQYGDFCAYRPVKAAHSATLGASIKSLGRRVVIITDDLPEYKPYAASLRLVSTVRDMIVLGLEVTIFAISPRGAQDAKLRSFFDADVEMVQASADVTLQSFLKARARCFDYVWLDGLQLAPQIWGALTAAQDGLPLTGYVCDARQLAFETGTRRTPMMGARDGWETLPEAAVSREEELTRLLWLFQAIVVASEREVETLRKSGIEKCCSLLIGEQRETSKSFRERADLLFALPVLERGDVGYRALHWTLREIMPRLEEKLGYPVQLHVSAVPENISLLTSLRHYIHLGAPLEGKAPLEALCDTARLMIDPSDASLSLTAEAECALGRGLPVIASGEGSENGVVYVSNAPELFVEAIATLYENEEAWDVYSEYARRDAPQREDNLANLKAILMSSKSHEKDW